MAPEPLAAAGPLARLDPRVTLLATLAFVVLVVATPAAWWRALAAEGLGLAFVVGLAGASPRDLLRRWLGFALLVAFLAAMVALGRPPAERVPTLAAIVAKNSLGFVAVLTMAAVTPWPRLIAALRRLRTPDALVLTLLFMQRYINIIINELERMALARRSRSFRRSGRLDWGVLSGLIGVLFVRCLERAERTHAAMRARGWDGTWRALDEADDR